MEIRHNTSLLEKAVEHSVQNASIPLRKAEAAAREVEAKAQALRRLATGGGIALAAIGIGFGIWLALREPVNPEQKAAELQMAALQEKLATLEGELEAAKNENDDLRREVEKTGANGADDTELRTQLEELKQKNAEQQSQLDEASKTADELRQRLTTMTGGDPLTNYTIFKSKTLTYKGMSWEVVTGHQFSSNQDKHWTFAWCYVSPVVDGVRIWVDLVKREEPNYLPNARVATEPTLMKAGMQWPDVFFLGSNCQWMDGATYTEEQLSGGAVPAEAASHSLTGDVLTYDGPIDQSFVDLLGRSQFKRLVLTSDGGSIMSSVKAGSLIRGRGAAVEVRGQCLSACVFVVAGGVYRVADPSAKIGVHQFYSSQPVDGATATSDAQQIASVIVQYLENQGVSPDLFHTMVKVPPEQMLIIPSEQLVAWKLLSGLPGDAPIVSLPEPTTPVDVPTAGRRQVFEARDMAGGDIGVQKGLSEQECELSCRLDSICKGFTFDRWNKACITKSALGTLALQPRSVTVVFSDKSPRYSNEPATILKRNGRSFPNTPFRKTTVGTFDACSAICMQDATCLGLNFSDSHGLCELFSAPNEYSPKDGVSIGIKQQANGSQ